MYQFHFLYKSMCTLMCYLILWHNILLTVSNLSLKCFIMHAQRAFCSSNSEINMHGGHKKDFIIKIFSLSSTFSLKIVPYVTKTLLFQVSWWLQRLWLGSCTWSEIIIVNHCEGPTNMIYISFRGRNLKLVHQAQSRSWDILKWTRTTM